MSGPEGFDFRERANGDVAIFHHGKLAKMLHGADAKKFLSAAKKGDAQTLMAEASGRTGAGRPGTGPMGDGRSLGGDGQSHAPGMFRRKSG